MLKQSQMLSSPRWRIKPHARRIRETPCKTTATADEETAVVKDNEPVYQMNTHCRNIRLGDWWFLKRYSPVYQSLWEIQVFSLPGLATSRGLASWHNDALTDGAKPWSQVLPRHAGGAGRPCRNVTEPGKSCSASAISNWQTVSFIPQETCYTVGYSDSVVGFELDLPQFQPNRQKSLLFFLLEITVMDPPRMATRDENQERPSQNGYQECKPGWTLPEWLPGM